MHSYTEHLEIPALVESGKKTNPALVWLMVCIVASGYFAAAPDGELPDLLIIPVTPHDQFPHFHFPLGLMTSTPFFMVLPVTEM